MQVVAEATATVQGNITDLDDDGWPAQPWAWINKLAHATWSELGDLAEARPRRARGWDGATAYLASEIRAYASTPEDLLHLQRSGLIPLELELLDGRIVPPHRPADLVTLVHTQIGKTHRFPSR